MCSIHTLAQKPDIQCHTRSSFNKSTRALCNKTKEIYYTIIQRTADIGLDAQYYVQSNSCEFFFLTGVNDTVTQSFCKVIILLRFISTVLFTVWAEGISESGAFLKLLY